MRVLFLLLGLFIVFSVLASETKEDSMYIEEIRIESIELGREGNLIEAFEKIELAITESKRVQLSERFINKRLKIILANRYSQIGDFDRAIELTKNLELFFKNDNDPEYELWAKNNLGVYNQNIGRYNVAYHYFLECWQREEEIDALIDKIDYLDGLSASCIKLGRLKEAKIYLEKAKNLLVIYQSEWKESLLFHNYVNESNYALAIEDDIQAEKFLLKGVKITEKLGFRKGADAYQLLARLLLKRGKNLEALDYAGRIIPLRGADKDTLAKGPYLLQSYLIQSKALLALGNYEKALIFCKKAEDQVTFFQQRYMFNESKLHIGELRRENLETAVLALYHQYKRSGKVEYLEQALVLSTEQNRTY